MPSAFDEGKQVIDRERRALHYVFTWKMAFHRGTGDGPTVFPEHELSLQEASQAWGSPGISVFLQEDWRMFHWTELSLPTNYALKASASERAGTNSFHRNGYKLEDI